MDIIKTTVKKTQLEDIAAALGLSKSTVSRAISGKGRVSAETRERVFAAIKEMNYRPNMLAKGLSESKTYNIGVVLPLDSGEADAPFFQTCLMGIVRECAVHDYDPVVIMTDRSDLSQLLRILENRKVDGVIITRPLADAAMETMLMRYEMPFVVIGKSAVSEAVCVDSSHREGCRLLTQYLLMPVNDQQRRVGLLIGNMQHMVNQARYGGFTDAFASKNAEPDPALIFTDVESPLQFNKALNQMLREKPHCILCGDDLICTRLLAELNVLGMKIPEDIQVASFYNSRYLDHYIPSVTALNFDAGTLGSTSAAALLDMLAGKEVAQNTLLNFEMLIRKSTL